MHLYIFIHKRICHRDTKLWYVKENYYYSALSCQKNTHCCINILYHWEWAYYYFYTYFLIIKWNCTNTFRNSILLNVIQTVFMFSEHEINTFGSVVVEPISNKAPVVFIHPCHSHNDNCCLCVTKNTKSFFARHLWLWLWR